MNHRMSLLAIVRRCAALTATALILTAGVAQADAVSSHYVASSVQPSASALANAKPIEQPLLSRAQMISMGIMNADGSFARPAGNQQRGRAATQPSQIISQGNPGGPVLAPRKVFSAASPSDGGATGSADKASQATVGGGGVAPMAFGYAEWPFTTARVQLSTKASTSAIYPYRAAGKLFIKNAYGTGWCSAALIGKGLLVTAAHCVANFGEGFMPGTTWTYYPGLYNGKSAYGYAAAQKIYAMTSYLNGSDGCTLDAPGVVCVNDVAVIVLTSKRGRYIGSRTGWLGWAYGGWGFTSAGETQITQLGYPGGIDYGNQMIRTDSLGKAWDATQAFNTLIGSLMNGGSSGGPWVTNFGMPPYLNGQIQPYASFPNIIVGVTSWGFTDNGAMAVQGASPFTASNIGQLVNAACTEYPSACAP